LGFDLKHSRVLAFAPVICLMLYAASTAAAQQTKPGPGTASTADRNGYVGNEACAKCHVAIYQSYQQTAMAKASGPAVDALTPADFTHKASGVHYRIYSENGRAWLSFERPGDPEMRGRRELRYFIGSGRRGRTYLFENDGFLFESPINWYANKQMWDTAPAYQAAREAPLDLPAYASCLHCHVSGMHAPERGSENRYGKPAFAQNGVSCERCHGPGAAHVSGSVVVNPAKLIPARRDEVCMQCHLEGKVAIERAGHHIYEYRPGDNLSDYIRYFELLGTQGSALGAVSQVEALAQSTCKKKAGDAMSCTSCHNPHEAVSPENRVAYFRAKCLSCHGAAFGEKHHSDRPDCTACHMPASASVDVAHTQVTDHRIPRRPQVGAQLLQDPSDTVSSLRLVLFPGGETTDPRDLALAWTSLVESGMSDAEPEARDQLSKALNQSPDDPAILSALGYMEQKRGNIDGARQLYQRALAMDPDLIDAATNLGVIEGRGGDLEGALKLWLSAFQNAPDRSGIGLNIARAYCAENKIPEARTAILRVLQFNPDLGSAKDMLRQLNATSPRCGN
jgi:predicted CXXCH cytochrome family protein